MRRFFMLALTAWIVSAVFFGSVRQADAGWHEFCQRCKLDWHRNNCYPKPFGQADRDAAAAPFLVMTQKGIQLQNTLSARYFDPQTNQLTYAGRKKVGDTLLYGLPGRKSLFVLQTTDADVNRVRLAAVQQECVRIKPSGPLPEVLPSYDELPARSGAYVEEVNRKKIREMPSPWLSPPAVPYNPAAGSGAGG